MSLFQMACKTYECLEDQVGIFQENEREPLTPISHVIQNAKIEITIKQNGSFISACEVRKDDEATIIPVTIESASRTSSFVPHPLCEQLVHLCNLESPNCQAYLAQLRRWVESAYSHNKAKAVLCYVESGSLLSDLVSSGLLDFESSFESNAITSALEKTPVGKKLIRWRIVPSNEPACWKDSTLFNSFIEFYAHQLDKHKKGFCQISGDIAVCTDAHPKGIVKMNYGAKLISANDSSGFTYRGRFMDKEQAGSVSYLVSQKTHNALRWLVANHAVIVDGRAFLCWNPQGRRLPESDSILSNSTFQLSEEKCSIEIYQKKLRETIQGYRLSLLPGDKVVIAVIDAPVTGRLAVVHYCEQTAEEYLGKIEEWYETCCWLYYQSVLSPSIQRIAKVAFGTERNDRIEVDDGTERNYWIEVDDRLKKSVMQRLFSCVTQGQRIPKDIVRALSLNASSLQKYKKESNREIVLSTACAVIRKSRKDAKREEWRMSLDEDIRNRSYLFGRLLAIAEKVEKDTYDLSEQRETNAIRLQSVFSQRPLYAWRIMEERLLPYYVRLKPAHRAYYKNLIGKIWEKIDADESEIRKPLEDIYLIGYYNQRAELYKKKDVTENTELLSESEK